MHPTEEQIHKYNSALAKILRAHSDIPPTTYAKLIKLYGEFYTNAYLTGSNDALKSVIDGLYLKNKIDTGKHLKVSPTDSEQTTPTIKEYPKEQYPTLEHLEDIICENAGVYDDSDDWDGYEETFTYDGKTYKALIEHDGTYMEYGTKGSEVTFTEIKE